MDWKLGFEWCVGWCNGWYRVGVLWGGRGCGFRVLEVLSRGFGGGENGLVGLGMWGGGFVWGE